LQYAPKPALLQRTRVRGCIAIALVAAATSAAALWGKPTWNKLQLLYWQARCMAYTAPADRVVFSTSGSKQVPEEWSQFYRALTSQAFRSAGTLFLHERRSPARHRRLVVVDVSEPNLCTGACQMIARVFVPASAFSKPREVIDIVSRNDAPFIPPNAVFYAAQIDPDDGSHFIIKYTVAGRTHLIDAWLTDDDRLLLQDRAAPVASLTP
jgi:hypothetical protein